MLSWTMDASQLLPDDRSAVSRIVRSEVDMHFTGFSKVSLSYHLRNTVLVNLLLLK